MFPRLTFWTRRSFLGEIRTLKAFSGDFRTLGGAMSVQILPENERRVRFSPENPGAPGPAAAKCPRCGCLTYRHRLLAICKLVVYAG